MKQATITSKGQMTVPAEIRAALGLEAGDRVNIEVTENGFIASVVRQPRPSDLYGIFAHAARPGTIRAQERAAYHAAVAERSSTTGDTP